jgi:hypothetical protein
MKLLNLSKKIILLIFFSVAFTFLLAEEDIDIWNKKNFDKKEKIKIVILIQTNAHQMIRALKYLKI